MDPRTGGGWTPDPGGAECVPTLGCATVVGVAGERGRAVGPGAGVGVASKRGVPLRHRRAPAGIHRHHRASAPAAPASRRGHRSREPGLRPGRTPDRDRLPVTGPARTILDCCAVLPDPRARLHLFDEARRLKLVHWDELWDCLLLHAGRGRHGLSARRILLERDGEVPPGTKFARRVSLLLEGAGLASPVYEYPVEFCGHKYFIDLAWPARMLAVECLGKIGHQFEKAFESDPVRRNHLQILGWDVLEITWKRLVHEPQAFVAEVRQSLCG